MVVVGTMMLFGQVYRIEGMRKQAGNILWMLRILIRIDNKEKKIESFTV